MCFSRAHLHNRAMRFCESSPESCSSACVYVLFICISIIIRSDQTQTATHSTSCLTHPPQPTPSLSPALCRGPPQPQLHWSSSVVVIISVTSPVPMVLFPSLRVNLWPFSRTIGWRRVSVNEVSSPGITIS